MGNLGVSPGTATTCLRLNVEPDGRPSPVLPQDVWSWRELQSRDGPLGTRGNFTLPIWPLGQNNLPLPIFTMGTHQRCHRDILGCFWLAVEALKLEQQ